MKTPKATWGSKVGPRPHALISSLRLRDSPALRRQNWADQSWAPPQPHPGSAPVIHNCIGSLAVIIDCKRVHDATLLLGYFTKLLALDVITEQSCWFSEYIVIWSLHLTQDNILPTSFSRGVNDISITQPIWLVRIQ